MKTWAVKIKTEKGFFLREHNGPNFKKTLTPKLMTYEEAKELCEFYNLFDWNAEPFDTENSIAKIERLYNGTL